MSTRYCEPVKQYLRVRTEISDPLRASRASLFRERLHTVQYESTRSACCNRANLVAEAPAKIKSIRGV